MNNRGVPYMAGGHTLGAGAPVEGFQTWRLTIRGVQKDDANLLFELHQDYLAATAFYQQLPQPNPMMMAEMLVNQAFQNTRYALLNGVICLRLPVVTNSLVHDPPDCALEQPLTLVPIGRVMLGSPPPEMAHHRYCKLELVMRREYRGSDYAREAGTFMVDWAFQMANMHRIYVEVYGWDHAGTGLFYKSLGFQQEGRKREHMWYFDRFWDVIQLSLLREEWIGLRNAQVAQVAQVPQIGFVQNGS